MRWAPYVVSAVVFLVGYNLMYPFLPNPDSVWMNLSLAAGWIGFGFVAGVKVLEMRSEEP